MNSNLDDSGISLPVFPSRTNLKLHNIYVTPKMIRKVIMDLGLSKTSGPDCIPVVFQWSSAACAAATVHRSHFFLFVPKRKIF